jgi:hypothetical protein
MAFIATVVVLEVFLLIVAYVAYRVFVRNTQIRPGYEIEVKLLPPSIRVKTSDDRD